MTVFHVICGAGVMTAYLACWAAGLLPWEAVLVYSAVLTVCSAEMGERYL